MLPVYLSIAWLSGILLGNLLQMPIWTPLVILLLIVPALFLRRFRRLIIVSCLCVLFLLGGAIRYQSSIPSLTSETIQFFNDKGSVQVSGTVSSAPEIKHSYKEFRLSANSVTVDNATYGIKGEVLLRLPFYKEIQYGDMLQVKGRLETPPQFSDFDYKNYLAHQGIYSTLNYPQIVKQDASSGFSPLAWIYDLRNRLGNSLSQCLPEPQASLAQAILLGLRGTLPESLVQSFYATGTTHLIAISGLNLTILLGFLILLTAQLFGRKNHYYLWISLLFIWLYTVLTGLPPSMVRATIMGSIFLIAELLGRQRNIEVAILLAAAVMVGVEPDIFWDASFQLSFLSMLGLAFIAPHIMKFTNSTTVKGNKGLVSNVKKVVVISFSTTAAAIIATWPVTALDFRSFSLAGAPATFFSMPSFPPIIVSSLLTSVLGMLWLPLGVVFGWVTWLFLSYFLLIVNLFASIPFANLNNLNLQPWQAVTYYVILGSALIAYHNRLYLQPGLIAVLDKIKAAYVKLRILSLQTKLRWILAPLLLANALCWIAVVSLPDQKLHVSILDVGQGESILIRTPDGQNIVVDSGPDAMSACNALDKKLPFWDRKIDLLILTQLQSDHISGTFELIKKYKLGAVAVSSFKVDSTLSKEVINAIHSNSVEVLTFYEGQQIDLGKNIRLEVLNPPERLMKGTDDDINNNSTGLRLAWNDVSFLLTADMAMDAEYRLMDERADLQSDVLKVGHHGSRYSTSDDFLAVVHPSVAVISAGLVNRFGHPNSEVVEKLANRVGKDRVLVTANCGTVEFTTDGHRLWYSIDNPGNK